MPDSTHFESSTIVSLVSLVAVALTCAAAWWLHEKTMRDLENNQKKIDDLTEHIKALSKEIDAESESD